MLAIGLHRVRDVAYALAGPRRLDPLVERFLGDTHQSLGLGVDSPYTECIATVAVITVELGNAVGAHYVALAKLVARRETVHHRLVDLNAKRAGKALVSQT